MRADCSDRKGFAALNLQDKREKGQSRQDRHSRRRER
uniref:Uncharacterized protein n=1 Tax=Anguilla anguilla TaxID=7936 RepID=A0A0E9V4K5_ANGAN